MQLRIVLVATLLACAPETRSSPHPKLELVDAPPVADIAPLVARELASSGAAHKQLLVYVGAIVVLVLFALMLTRAPIGANPDISTGRLHRVLAALLGAGVTALLAASLLPLAGPEAVERRDTSTTQVAEQLFGTWVWPFEVLSLLLLVALVAAMAVSRMARPPADVGADGEGAA